MLIATSKDEKNSQGRTITILNVSQTFSHTDTNQIQKKN